jgi:hypothetical protein
MKPLAELSTIAWLQLAAGICGFVAAILVSAPAILTIDSRRTLIQAASLRLQIEDRALLNEQEGLLLQEALRELLRERRFLQSGFGPLALSFVLTICATLAG